MDEEHMQRDLEALEEEKEDYIENHPQEGSEEEEEIDVEETEFSLSEDEIDEWISSLQSLKEQKGTVDLEVDEQNILKIHYSNEEEEDNE